MRKCLVRSRPTRTNFQVVAAFFGEIIEEREAGLAAGRRSEAQDTHEADSSRATRADSTPKTKETLPSAGFLSIIGNFRAAGIVSLKTPTPQPLDKLPLK